MEHNPADPARTDDPAPSTGAARTAGAAALKGLAHPLRMEIFDALSKFGPQTATKLAQRLGESTGSTSYHLRQLARHNFIRPVEGRSGGREKWWERTPGPLNIEPRIAKDDPAASAAGGFVIREMARANARALEEFIETAISGAGIPEDWEQASISHTRNLRLTSAQLREINEHVYDVTRAFIDRYQGLDDPGSRPVQIQINAFPLVNGEETPS